MTFGSLFAGIGGFDLGLERAGMECRWQVENNPYSIRVLEKHWPKIKRYGDITTLDGHELEGVSLICGGFPCQDISVAGTGGGITAARSGLWRYFARVVGEVRPKCVLVENSPALRGRGLAVVLQDLDALGFDAEWHCVPASAVGAPHIRDRIYILAYARGWGLGAGLAQEYAGESDTARGVDAGTHGRGRDESANGGAKITDPPSPRRSEGRPEEGGPLRNETRGPEPERRGGEPLARAARERGETHYWASEPGVVRMVSRIPSRMDRIKGLGNAVVPQVAEWLGHQIMKSLCRERGIDLAMRDADQQAEMYLEAQ